LYDEGSDYCGVGVVAGSDSAVLDLAGSIAQRAGDASGNTGITSDTNAD
jgi:hypothetical protein